MVAAVVAGVGATGAAADTDEDTEEDVEEDVEADVEAEFEVDGVPGADDRIVGAGCPTGAGRTAFAAVVGRSFVVDRSAGADDAVGRTAGAWVSCNTTSTVSATRTGMA